MTNKRSQNIPPSQTKVEIEGPIKKEENNKSTISSHNKDRTSVIPRLPIKSRYQHIFFCYFYYCNNFGHKALNCKAYGKFCDYKKNASSNKPKVRNHNFFAPLQRYDIECYKCNNPGHIARDCKLMTPTKKVAEKEFQD